MPDGAIETVSGNGNKFISVHALRPILMWLDAIRAVEEEAREKMPGSQFYVSLKFIQISRKVQQKKGFSSLLFF